MLNLATMTIPEIAAKLRTKGLDLNVQSAVEILRGFGGGSLLEWQPIRDQLVDDRGTVLVRWSKLADAVDAKDPGLVYLSSSAWGALRLACALACGRPIENLGYELCRFDRANADVVLRALAISLHLVIDNVSADRR